MPGGDPRIGEEFAGYRIEALIGKGGMGTVYLAEQLRLKRRVALKLLGAQLAEDAGFRERFIHESQLAAACEHPNVIPIYDAAEREGMLYIVMRYVEGADLRSVLDREGRLTPARTLAVVEDAAGALDATHATGLVHRDVKPGNILIGESDGRVYLTDFGIAKRTSSGGLTRTGFFLGTLDYAAPEQIEGKPVTPSTDVYSLGCVAFECLAGEPPFLRDSDLAVITAHLTDPPPRLSERRPGLPLAVDGVIEQALAKDPAARFRSCGDMAGALRAGLADGSPTGVAERPAAAPTRRTATAAPAAGAPRAEGTARTGARAAAALALVGALALLPAVWISLSADVRITVWNTQAVLSALEAGAVAAAVAGIAVALLAERIREPLAAGLLVGFGALTVVACLALRSFAAEWLELGTAVTLLPLASVAILAAGLACLGLRGPGAGRGVGQVALWLGVSGVVLLFVALFVDYDGESALIDEANQFVPEPVAVIVAAVLALVVGGVLSRGLVAAGLLLAVGTQSALHYLGVIGAAWKAIGEPGEVDAGGFIGLLGGLLVAAAGTYALHTNEPAEPTHPAVQRTERV